MMAGENSAIDTLISDGVLGETHGEIRFSGRDPLRNLSLALCRQARRKVQIFSHSLDAYSYNGSEMDEALRQLVLRSPHTSLQILLQNNEQVRLHGHRLLDLAQRLSSRVQIFRPHLQRHLDHTENFLLVDEVGYVRQPLLSQPQAIGSFNDPAQARELSHFFQEVWQQSEPDSLLRRLSI